MDSDRFDALARSLSIRSPRRATLAAGAAGLTALLGFASADARKKRKGKKKKRKKPKPDCGGDLDGPPCGDTCCSPIGQKCCDGACIPESSCCTDRGVVPTSGRYDQCGLCIFGNLYSDPTPCRTLDPDGCTICSGYQCIPGNDGLQCSGVGGCGVCSGGLCEGPGGGPPEPICGQGCCQLPAACCRGTTLTECCAPGNCCPSGHCALPEFCPAG